MCLREKERERKGERECVCVREREIEREREIKTSPKFHLRFCLSLSHSLTFFPSPSLPLSPSANQYAAHFRVGEISFATETGRFHRSKSDLLRKKVFRCFFRTKKGVFVKWICLKLTNCFVKEKKKCRGGQ